MTSFDLQKNTSSENEQLQPRTPVTRQITYGLLAMENKRYNNAIL